MVELEVFQHLNQLLKQEEVGVELPLRVKQHLLIIIQETEVQAQQVQ